MNIERGMLVQAPLHHSVVVQQGDFMNQLLDADDNAVDNGVGTLLPLLYQSGRQSADTVTRRSNESADTIDIMKDDRPTSPPADTTNATCSTGSTEDDASVLTSVTLELRKAAEKTIRHAQSRRQVNAAVPLHVKESMLEKEFPHVRGNSDSTASGSVDSMIDVRSVDSLSAQVEHSSLNQVLDERERRGSVIDYNDCVQTLPDAEMLQLRNAMYNYEKQRVMEMMEYLSNQMKSYHEVLEENDSLRKEITQVKVEKEEKVSELEKTLIDMKLNLAMCQGREDHTRLSAVRLEIDLKKALDENRRLQQKMCTPDGPKPGPRDNRRFAKSLPSADSLNHNVHGCEPMQRKNSLLTRSWFGKDGLHYFFDRPSRGEDHGKSPGGSFFDKPTPGAAVQPRNSPADEDPPPKPAVPTRSRSFVDPNRVRALKECEFMHWNSSEKSEDEATVGSKLTRSRSFLHPREARRWQEPVGFDVVLPRSERSNIEAFGSRSTILSNITDISLEDGNLVAEEIRSALLMDSSLSRSRDDRIPRVNSGWSHSTLSFEPAKPQLQHALSLRGVQVKCSLLIS